MDTVRTTARAKETAHAVTMEALEIGGIETIIGVYFNCPSEQRGEVLQAWADEILTSAASAGLDTNSPDFILLVVSLEPCGGQATYRVADDIPLVDTPCPCGDPNHWLIRWAE